MAIIKSLIVNATLLLILTISMPAQAADQPTVGSVPEFNVGASSATDQSGIADSPQAVRAAKHQLYLPDKTPVPLEGYRWPTTNLKFTWRPATERSRPPSAMPLKRGTRPVSSI